MGKNNLQNRKKKCMSTVCFASILIIVFIFYFAFNFSKIVNYLNYNVGTVQGIFTLILVVITAYYAWQTKRTVNIMQKSEIERNRPRISVFIKQREDWVNFVYLVIVNHGNDIAKNISFDISTDIELTLSNGKLSEVRQIRDGIKNLTPKRELVIPFLNLVEKLDDFKDSDIKITVRYFDIFENEFIEEFSLDMTSVIEYQVGKPPIHKISKDLEKISKDMEKIRRKFQ